jgi:hypothetical protein
LFPARHSLSNPSHDILPRFVLKNKFTLRDWSKLIALGLAGILAYHFIIGLVAILIGLVVAAFSDVPWYLGAVFSYLGIKILIGGLDCFAEWKPTRCPACRRKIKTSNPIKCEECGGAAQLAGKDYKTKKRP